MMFTNLRKAVREEIGKGVFQSIERIENAENTLEDSVKWYLSPLMLKKFKAGTLDAETAKKKILAKINNTAEKKLTQEFAKITRIENAMPAEKITITVEWKKNRTWGNNPTATVRTDQYNTATGTASGCGYDKESSAIADALNSLPEVLHILYATKDKATTGESCHTVLGYGSGYWSLPHFEGGVGVSCFQSIFEKLGYAWEHVSWTDSSDVYQIIKK